VIFNAEGRQDDWFREASFDVCVVGAGPAGITVSRALARRGWMVGLFEGGGEELSQESQELYIGDVVGEKYHPLDKTRLRYLGGTSNHWSGFCRELDASDFELHPANPKSGWPITKTDLDGYAAETDAILGLPPRQPAPPYLLANVSLFTPINFRVVPTRFRTKFHEELAQSPRIKLYLNANLVDITLDSARRAVSHLSFRSFHREGAFSVKAKYFVLCLGGIENARILLNSQSGDRYGIGNQNDCVGRYFSEHLHFVLGAVLQKKKLPKAMLFFGPTPEMMNQAQILNFSVRLRETRRTHDSLSRRIACSTSFTQKLAAAIGAPVDCNPLGLLRIASEQALNPDSRIELTEKADRFGLRRLALNWRLSPIDLRTLRLTAIEWARLMATQDLGRVRLVDWVVNPALPLPSVGQDEVVGNHHLCTTRMSANPKEGVVDGTCRVYGTENLYLGGSSVFGTGGASNPTYTIVQLALRLADHLDARFG
jgi:choline dehydrogenase-like flavoprotein